MSKVSYDDVVKLALYTEEPPARPSVPAEGYVRQSLPLRPFHRVVVPLCFYAETSYCKPSLWRRITNFWSRVRFQWPVYFGED